MNILRTEHNFSSKLKKILNLCLRWHILRIYHFVAEVTFKRKKKLREENVARNFEIFAIFLPCNNLLSELPRHLILAAFNFFEIMFLSYFFLKREKCLHLKCDIGPFSHFPTPTLLTFLIFFWCCGNNFDFLISVTLIPATFYLKIIKKIFATLATFYGSYILLYRLYFHINLNSKKKISRFHIFHI